MKFEDISSKEDFEEHFFYDKGFDYIDDETFWIDKEHMAKYYFVDNLNYSKAYQLYRKKKGFEMTPYCIFIDNAFDVYYIFSEYHTPFKFVYDKNRRERNYTKQSRLQLLNALNYEDKAYNDSFQALFDTKPLVKKFYDEYKAMKSRLSNSIKGLADGERWFYSQVLFDRIIFIYFLQSRGIIKENFLTNLYKNRDKKRNFFKDYLVPLFFNAFNTQHEIYEKVEVNGIDFGHVPYLNGGLFRKKDVELDNEIQIKDEIWGEIFNHFDSYEWVVEERQKDAVVLTPSILGHIFEQSVTGRKEKGAYYTPSEITDYISMNTIYPYITDRLNERFGTNYRNITSELLRKDDLSENDIDKIAFLYFNILKELRVLDNACGSGAFLMAAHKILLALYRQCYRILKDEMVFSAENMEIEKYGSPDYYFKRVIATNNIYGVDLEEGAVEIAKLRLWLAMISDLSVGNVEPLPNIDYNIMPGNTLIGYVEAPLIEQATLDSSDTTKQIIKAKGALLSQYKATTDPQTAANLKKDIERINEKFRPELDEKFYRLLTGEHKIDISKEDLESLNPFHWGFEFYEAFDLDEPKEERGFDVVIGNPPYVRIQEMKKQNPRLVDLYNAFFKTPHKNYDISVLFFEQSVNTIREGGYHSYIATNRWFTGDYGEKLRDFLSSNQYIKEITDFGRNQVFCGISTYTAVSIIRKSLNNSFNYRLIHEIRDIRDFKNIKLEPIRPQTINNKPWVILTGKEKEIEGKLKVLPTLGNLSKKIFVGLQTSADPIYILEFKSNDSSYVKVFSKLLNRTYQIEKEILKILLKGKEIKRYFVENNDYVLIFPYNIKIKNEIVKVDLISEENIKNKYPNTWKYFEDNIEKLKRRADVDKQSEWYRYVYKKNLGEFEQPKIMTQVLAKNASFTLDKKGEYYFVGGGNAGGYGVTLKKNAGISLECLLPLLNSKLLDWYLKKVSVQFRGGFYSYAKRFIEQLPIKIPDTQDVYETLTNYMLKLNSDEKSNENITNFFDTQLLDSLVYTLYFKEKFQEDSVPTNLPELMEPYLVDIEDLESDKEKTEVIESVYERITADREIMECIEKIKGHEWVKVIEEVE